MTVTAASFRSLYPEFSDITKYPDAAIAQWLVVAGQVMNAERWSDLLDYGTCLFLAHRMALQAKAQRAAAFGKTPGDGSGLVTSKGVDKVNISYDVTSVTEEGGGFWNLTTYGQEYIRQARLMGAGPVQIGVPVDSESQSLYSGAWAGPYYP